MNDGTDEEDKLILALDVGGTKIAGSVLRFSSGHMPELIRLVQEPTQAQEGGLAVLQRIVEFSCELLGRIDREVMGIGIGAAGVIALDGSIESATSLMPGWSGMPLGPALRAATGKTVSVVGDVHAHALGEAHWGAGRDVSSMLLVAVGTGIGGAMVLGGHVLHGAHNVGGHIGHVCHPDARRIRCSCGRYGHVEPIASGLGIERCYHKLSGKDARGDRIAEMARNGDNDAQSAVLMAGRALGNTLGMQANMLDPEMIVLSGSVCGAGELWLDAVRQGYQDQVIDALSDIPIVPGTLGAQAPILGAAVPLAQYLGLIEGDEGTAVEKDPICVIS